MNNRQDASSLKSVGSLLRLFSAMRYSVRGFRAAYRTEAAFRQELALLIPTLAALFFSSATMLEKVVVTALAGHLLVVELINSAIEALVDRVSLEIHPLSGKAKDIGSAAVFIALFTFVGAWCVTVLPWAFSMFR